MATRSGRTNPHWPKMQATTAHPIRNSPSSRLMAPIAAAVEITKHTRNTDIGEGSGFGSMPAFYPRTKTIRQFRITAWTSRAPLPRSSPPSCCSCGRGTWGFVWRWFIRRSDQFSGLSRPVCTMATLATIGSIASIFFRRYSGPSEQIDRKLRPEAWRLPDGVG